MKRFLALLTVLMLVVTAGPAMSTELFVRKKDNALPDVPPSQSQTQQPQPTTAPPEPTAPPATDPAPEAEAPDTIEDFAARYTQNCQKKQDPILKGEPLRMLCECSAGKLKETMTVEEVKTMMTDTPQGLAQRNRMAVHVYAPCMEYPTRALLFHNCQANKDVLTKYKNADRLCTCMADDMAKFIAEKAPAIMAQRLMDNPNDLDPLGGLYSSEAFQAKTQISFMGCVSKYPVVP